MPPSSRSGSAVALLAACVIACAANEFSGGDTARSVSTFAADSTQPSLELACEVALRRLDDLLAARNEDPPGTAVVEARSLRQEALEQMGVADYELALDLIQSAITLLEQSQ